MKMVQGYKGNPSVSYCKRKKTGKSALQYIPIVAVYRSGLEIYGPTETI